MSIEHDYQQTDNIIHSLLKKLYSLDRRFEMITEDVQASLFRAERLLQSMGGKAVPVGDRSKDCVQQYKSIIDDLQ